MTTPSTTRAYVRAQDLLSADEIRAITAKSDAMGWWAIGRTWLLIAITFAALATWANPAVFVLAVLVLGGQQLTLAILSHEAAHRTLFQRRELNTDLADWLCARPIWLDVARYREHHLRHHAHTGTELDPDLSLVAPFPGSRRSLWRKLLRDASGLTGLRRVLGLVLMDLGVLRYTVAAEVEKLPRNGRTAWDYLREGGRHFWPVLLSNLVLIALLAACGEAWLYSAWIVAYLTSFSLFLRIRSIAEHACTEGGADPLRNTRSTRANWLARLTVAPMHVNYHIEHHLLASVPWFRLPQLHRLLQKRGAVVPAPGYREVLRIASSG